MIAAAILLTQVAAPAVLHLRVETGGDRCLLVMGVRVVDMMDSHALDTALAAVDPKPVEAIVTGRSDTPYRCLGGIVYTLQLRGFRKIAFDWTDTNPRSAR